MIHTYIQLLGAKIFEFVRDESGDEIFEKAAVIAAVTAGVLVIIVLGSLAANALQQGQSWFGG